MGFRHKAMRKSINEVYQGQILWSGRASHDQVNNSGVRKSSMQYACNIADERASPRYLGLPYGAVDKVDSVAVGLNNETPEVL